MKQYTDFVSRQRNEQTKKEKEAAAVIHCPNCQSKWFEEIKVGRYKSDHQIILGQNVPLMPGSLQYVLLKCVGCSDYLEPLVQHNSRDIASGDYSDFLDTLDKKESKKESKVEKKNAIQSQKL